MNKKITLYSEAAYVIGITILAFATALMEKASFGMSMVVAPAYLIHLKMSQYFAWFTFGVSEYIFQAFLIIVLSIVMGKLKKGYFMSFVTAVIYGTILDASIWIVGLIPFDGIAARIVCFALGIIICALGVAMLFMTYISPEAYELVVKEISVNYKKDIGKVKTIYDCSSCVLGIILSFIFFGLGHFVGVSFGTVICALVNGWLIGRFSRLYGRVFEVKDALKLRDWFTK